MSSSPVVLMIQPRLQPSLCTTDQTQVRIPMLWLCFLLNSISRTGMAYGQDHGMRRTMRLA